VLHKKWLTCAAEDHTREARDLHPCPRVNADSSVPCPRSDEDGLPRGGMLITATDYDVVYQLVVRFGNERAVVTIRSRADGTATLATGPGEPPL